MLRILVLLAVIACPAGARGMQDVRGCVQADGRIVYTDGFCAAGQSEKADPAPTAPVTARMPNAVSPPPRCSATVTELQSAVRDALDQQDVNALAKSYHWPGVSSDQAETLMIRLEKLGKTPLLDVVLQYSEPAAAVTSEDMAIDDYDYEPIDPERLGNAQGLKIVYYAQDGGSRTAATVFRLHRHFDCWWIRY